MGFWDVINSGTDKLPNLGWVKRAYTSSCAAVSKISKSAPPDLTTPAQTLYNDTCSAVAKIHVDEVRRSKIGMFATKFVHNAADYAIHEGVKCIPGGVAVAKIVSKTLNDVKSEIHEDQVTKAAQAKMGGLEETVAQKQGYELGTQHKFLSKL